MKYFLLVLILISATAVASTYVSPSTAASTYVSSSTAASTYVSPSTAASTYVSPSTAASTYVSQSTAASTEKSQSTASGYAHTPSNTPTNSGVMITNTPPTATARPPAMRHSDVRLRTGVRLHYVEQGDPNGPPIILLHGYSDSWVSYTRVLPLIDRKYHVYIPDQRGHGDSDRPASGYTFPDFAGDVLAFMDAKGLKKATIVGHSMGSFVAQHVATMAPKRVEKLVLVGSAPAVRNETVLQLQREVSALSDPVSIKFVREFQTSVISQPVPDEFIDRVIQESLKLPARVWRDTMAGMLAANAKVDLSKVTAPTLIIWGDRESVFPNRLDQDVLRKAIPNARLKVYLGTGHCPNWEEPVQFVKDLKEFMGEGNG